MMPVLSIVIPVYNLSDLIVCCLDSICHQSIDESQFEVIVVDDGSVDNSLAVINEYAKAHGNIHVYQQNNSGVSRARNLAMSKCSGKYISFVDADDELLEGGLVTLLDRIAVGTPPDIIYCRTFRGSSHEKLTETHLWQARFSEGGKYIGRDLLSCGYLNGGSVCGGFYKKSFIDECNLRFGEGIANGEDTIFNLLLYSQNPTISFLDIKMNFFRIREGSASESASISRVERFKMNMQYLSDMKNKSEPGSLRMQVLDFAIYQSVLAATDMYIQTGGRNWRFVYNIMGLKTVPRLKVPWARKRQRLRIKVLNISYFLFYYLNLFKSFFRNR